MLNATLFESDLSKVPILECTLNFLFRSQAFTSISPSRYPKIKVEVKINPFWLKELCIEKAMKIINHTLKMILKQIFSKLRVSSLAKIVNKR